MDYIKIFLININIDRLLGLDMLDFKVEVSTTTGELREYQCAKYHHCIIKIYDSGLVQFSGSIHKLYNSIEGIKAPENGDKGFNGNDFTINDINTIKKHLTNLFDCELEQMEIKNIEFGVNIVTRFPVKQFSKGLLYHNGKVFTSQRNQSYWQCEHSNYIVKIYDKGNQYKMPQNTIRVEIKVTRMEEIKHIGITTFEDVNTSTLSKAYNHLLKRFDEVVYYDRTIDKKQLTRIELIKIKDYSNQSYWMDLESKKRDRPKKKLNQLINLYSEKLKDQIRTAIVKKCVIINRLSEKAKCVIINSSSIGLNITHLEPRICPITGVDISMQRKDSYMLSNAGLKHLEKTNPSEFERLYNVLLTGNPNKYENGIYSMMSKQIRNRNSKQLPSNQMAIF